MNDDWTKRFDAANAKYEKCRLAFMNANDVLSEQIRNDAVVPVRSAEINAWSVAKDASDAASAECTAVAIERRETAGR